MSTNEVGALIREARQRSGWSQARLARLAGISQRQLSAIERGANTSTRVLTRLAEVLQLKEIPLGPANARVAGGFTTEIRLLLDRASAAEILIRDADAALGQITLALQRYAAGRSDIIADRASAIEGETISVPIAGEIATGHPIRWSAATEMVTIDRLRIDGGELALRFRSKRKNEVASDGDLLIIHLRPTGNVATGELAVVLVEEKAVVGRWWNKSGQRSVRSWRGDAVIREIRPGEPVVLVGVITDIVRIERAGG